MLASCLSFIARSHIGPEERWLIRWVSECTPQCRHMLETVNVVGMPVSKSLRVDSRDCYGYAGYVLAGTVTIDR